MSAFVIAPLLLFAGGLEVCAPLVSVVVITSAHSLLMLSVSLSAPLMAPLSSSSTLFLLPATISGGSGIARNTVLATPVENIDLYYIDPGDSEFARLGLNYTTQGETNLIGFHAQGNYSTAVGESYAIMGMKLWAEYLDGIAKITVSAGG